MRLAGGGARQAEGGLRHFRTGGAEADALGGGNAFAEDAGGFEFDLRLAGVKNALVDLVLDRLLHGLGRVAQHHRAHAAVIVDQPVAIGIDQIGPSPRSNTSGPPAMPMRKLLLTPPAKCLRVFRDQRGGTVERQVT